MQKDRIEEVSKYPDDAMFLVTNYAGNFWDYTNMGYSPYLHHAKVFTKERILVMLQNNGLIDKKILAFITPQVI